MKIKIWFIVAFIVMAFVVAQGASSRAMDSCESINAKKPTTVFANFATFYGYTTFCFGTYYWTIKVQKLENGVWTNLGTISGGPTTIERYWTINDPPVLTVQCLYPDGTAMTVRDQLYVNIGGQGHTNGSDRVQCVRNGQHAP
jgi:hypothetical protein